MPRQGGDRGKTSKAPKTNYYYHYRFASMQKMTKIKHSSSLLAVLALTVI